MSDNDRIRRAMLYGMSLDQRKKFLLKERIATLVAVPFVLAFFGGIIWLWWSIWSECRVDHSFWFCMVALK